MKIYQKKTKPVSVWTVNALKEYLDTNGGNEDDFNELKPMIRKVEFIFVDYCPYASEINGELKLLWATDINVLNDMIYDAAQEI